MAESLSFSFSIQQVYSLEREVVDARLSIEEVGTTSLLNTILRNSIPISSKNPINPATLRDFGAGGTYVVSHAELKHDLGMEDFSFGHQSLTGKHYSKGSSVVVKALNPDILENESRQEVDYTSISTELTILSHPAVMESPTIVNCIGIGWDPSPVETTEPVPYYPYLLTESGDVETWRNSFELSTAKQAFRKMGDA